MKKSVSTAILAMILATFSACAQETHEHQSKKDTVKTDTETSQTVNIADVKASASIKQIVEHYLHIKNALVADNANVAAKAGGELATAFKEFDKKDLTAEQKKDYEKIADDAKEHAGNIGADAGNIERQREHFKMLSKDIYDLVKTFGSEELLYKDFCPMYDKGSIWLSETKDIQNPYYGKKMLTCGSMKEEIK